MKKGKNSKILKFKIQNSYYNFAWSFPRKAMPLVFLKTE